MALKVEYGFTTKLLLPNDLNDKRYDIRPE